VNIAVFKKEQKKASPSRSPIKPSKKELSPVKEQPKKESLPLPPQKNKRTSK